MHPWPMQEPTLRAMAVHMAQTDGGPVMGDVYTCIAFEGGPSSFSALRRDFFVGAASGTVHQAWPARQHLLSAHMLLQLLLVFQSLAAAVKIVACTAVAKS